MLAANQDDAGSGRGIGGGTPGRRAAELSAMETDAQAESSASVDRSSWRAVGVEEVASRDQQQVASCLSRDFQQLVQGSDVSLSCLGDDAWGDGRVVSGETPPAPTLPAQCRRIGDVTVRFHQDRQRRLALRIDSLPLCEEGGEGRECGGRRPFRRRSGSASRGSTTTSSTTCSSACWSVSADDKDASDIAIVAEQAVAAKTAGRRVAVGLSQLLSETAFIQKPCYLHSQGRRVSWSNQQPGDAVFDRVRQATDVSWRRLADRTPSPRRAVTRTPRRRDGTTTTEARS